VHLVGFYYKKMRRCDIAVMRIILGSSRRTERKFKITKMIAKSYGFCYKKMGRFDIAVMRHIRK